MKAIHQGAYNSGFRRLAFFHPETKDCNYWLGNSELFALLLPSLKHISKRKAARWFKIFCCKPALGYRVDAAFDIGYVRSCVALHQRHFVDVNLIWNG
jgi:hypothetical protein